MEKIEHNYQSIEGWFNMEKQYLELLNNCPEGGIFVELGAYKGKSTSFIVTKMINQNRNIKFYTVDTFQGDSGSTDEREVDAYKRVDVSEMYQEYLKNTEHLKNYYETMVNYSHEAAEYFLDNSVDCLFIDAGHSHEAVKKDIEAWLPKMKSGGIISGHDYNAWEGVNKAVNELLGKPDKIENDCWFIKIK